MPKKDRSKIQTHPGRVLFNDYLKPLKLCPKRLALDLELDVKEFFMIIRAKKDITIEVAEKLSEKFDTTVDFWMDLQKEYNDNNTKSAVAKGHGETREEK